MVDNMTETCRLCCTVNNNWMSSSFQLCAYFRFQLPSENKSHLPPRIIEKQMTPKLRTADRILGLKHQANKNYSRLIKVNCKILSLYVASYGPKLYNYLKTDENAINDVRSHTYRKWNMRITCVNRLLAFFAQKIFSWSQFKGAVSR